MAQLFVEGGQPEKNLARAENLIAAAARAACRIVVLPECCDLGWTDPSARELAGEIPGGPAYERLAAAAARHGLWVVAGLVERAGDRRYNSVVMIDDQGRLAGRGRKINVLSIARDYYAIGDTLGVVHTPFGDVGLNICADNFSSCLSVGDVLGRMGARMILSPCSWADDAEGVADYAYHVHFWVDSYARLARHHRLSVVGVSNVGVLKAGPWAGKQVVGSSVAVGPDGQVLALCKTGWTEAAEQLLPVDLPLEPPPALGTDILPLP